MNYAAKVSGAGNQAYGKFNGGYGGTTAAWFLVLFILLVIIIACVL
ncbi:MULTISPECIES: sporulation protein YjcZ [Paenibacillus]|nr:sporulation protein YjcZ [Paenibacillus camelliae]MCM3633977.1 sporulation protein YjcZ [Paenibacillus camelliae]